jgi:hypothetical protein
MQQSELECAAIAEQDAECGDDEADRDFDNVLQKTSINEEIFPLLSKQYVGKDKIDNIISCAILSESKLLRDYKHGNI